MSSPGRRSRSPSSGSSPSSESRPNKQPRKARKKYSCEECRRLKLKCDREFPCQNCIKRGCREICPGGVRPAIRRSRKREDSSRSWRSARELELERLLAENGITLPQAEASTARAAVVDKAGPSSTPTRRPAPSVSNERTAQASLSPEGLFHIPPADSQPEPVGGTASLSFRATGSSSLDPLVTAASLETPHDLSLFTSANASEYINDPPSNPAPPEQVTSVPRSYTDDLDSNAMNYDDGIGSGTLVITTAGRSKYLGPRAGNEWLKDQEIDEPDETASLSRPPSPEPQSDLDSRDARHSKVERAGKSFPFASSSRGISISSLLRRLPPESQGRALLDSYFRYFSWSYNIVPEEKLTSLVDQVYKQGADPGATSDAVVLFVHQLALVFVVLAMGALHNLELQPDDPTAEEFLSAARACLTKGNFLVYNTVPAVQTLHLMAHVHLETEKGRNGDTAWPLWGLAMRMIQAMGIHRDGTRWNLSEDDVEERRRVFWNMQAADVFQANCFSRPNSLQLRHCDVQFPHDARMISSDAQDRDFHTVKFQISRISADILDQTLDLTMPPSMEAVRELHNRLVDFEKSLPFRLRCRVALQALPSLYNSNEEAVQNSPEIDRWDLTLTFQQHFIAHLFSEALVNLHRPFFVCALKARPDDPIKSKFGASFLVVVERSNALIQIACAQHAIHPNVAARHWFLWFHAFNSAVTLGTVILADPHNALASFCLAQMDQVVAVYTSIVMSRTSPRMSSNLRWLTRLRQRAVEILEHIGAQPGNVSAGGGEDDTELLGWRTRLVERTSKGVRRATTIPSNTSPATTLTTPSPHARLDQRISNAIEEYLSGPPEGPHPTTAAPDLETAQGELYSSTDQMLHNFWDPTTVLGITGEGDSGMGAFGFWDLDFAALGQGTASGEQT